MGNLDINSNVFGSVLLLLLLFPLPLLFDCLANCLAYFLESNQSLNKAI
nr:MAG TPA: hypothetical protein [Crassvirales sp.]